MDESQIPFLLDKARKNINRGRFLSAKKILLPLVECKNPEAMFLYSNFSIKNDETEENFDKRSISLLIESSKLGYVPAMYALAVCYCYGDGVKEDRTLASSIFKELAERGYSRAKLDYGLDLYYGSNGIQKDKEFGLYYIRQAVIDKVDGAAEKLKELENARCNL